MNATIQGKQNARKPLARGTSPMIATTGVDFVTVRPSCAKTRIKLAIAASIVAPQGHAITVALRALVARRALVLRTR